MDHILFDGISFYEMLLDYPFQDFRRTGVIPYTIRINNSNRSFHAEAQAVCFGPVNALFIEIKLLYSAFQIVPGFQSFFLRAAFRF